MKTFYMLLGVAFLNKHMYSTYLISASFSFFSGLNWCTKIPENKTEIKINKNYMNKWKKNDKSTQQNYFNYNWN